MRNFLIRKHFLRLRTLLPRSGKTTPNSILILFDSARDQGHAQIMRWLYASRDRFSLVGLIGLNLRKSQAVPGDVPALTGRDLTWYGCLKADAVRRVWPGFNPEYLIVLTQKPHSAIDRLVEIVQARLKIGVRPIREQAYNLIIDAPGDRWDKILGEIDRLMPKLELVEI